MRLIVSHDSNTPYDDSKFQMAVIFFYTVLFWTHKVLSPKTQPDVSYVASEASLAIYLWSKVLDSKNQHLLSAI